MDTLGLSLRQKKLLHLLRGMDTFITGSALARQMNVSVRTIRSDIAGINQALSSYRAEIYSEHSKGYLYIAEDPEAIRSMNQIDNAFFTRDERVRYLAFRFCLSDEPLDLYDLEDEIYVSHTTLEHDIRQLKMKYVLSEPHIPFQQNREFVSFARDERKRRYILNHLFHADWDYHTKDNAYYSYHFLDKDRLSFIMEEIPLHLNRHGITLEDPSLVSLNLAVAIMLHRTESGHMLPECELLPRKNQAVSLAVDDLFEVLKSHFHREFAREEQEEIYRMVENACIVDVSSVTRENASRYFDSVTIQLADAFLEKILQVFGLDFSLDEDFYRTLLAYIRYLQIPEPIFNEQENPEISRENLLPEFEIAWLFQDLSLYYLGYYLGQTELLYLAHCISGALEYLFHTHPEKKLRTIICCHLNMPAAWSLKRKVLGAFEKYLAVQALVPVNAKSVLDFENTDLVLSTVRKAITDHPGTDTIQIGTLLPPKDYLTLSSYIQNYRMKKLCPPGSLSVEQLLREAIWLERVKAASKFEILESMCESLLQSGVISPGYEADLLRREAISTFSFHPGILFLHSLVPAVKTRLAVSVFEHRINWNSHKIRIIVLAAFAPEDTGLVFLLNQTFNDPSLDPDTIKNLKTRKEILDFFCCKAL